MPAERVVTIRDERVQTLASEALDIWWCGEPGVGRARLDATVRGTWARNERINELGLALVPWLEEGSRTIKPIEKPLHLTFEVFSTAVRCVAAPEATEDGSGTSTSAADPSGLACPGAELVPPEEGGHALDVRKLTDGLCYSERQFSSASPPDQCDEVHYHTQLISLDGTVRPDSDPCGAATDADIVAVGTIHVSEGQAAYEG